MIAEQCGIGYSSVEWSGGNGSGRGSGSVLQLRQLWGHDWTIKMMNGADDDADAARSESDDYDADADW